MNENGVHVGPIRFWRARTRSLLDAATVAKKANFLHANADRGPAGNSLKGKKPMIDPNSSDPSSATPEFTSEHGSCTLMDRFVMMVKGLVLFLFPRMVPFLSFQTDWKKNAQITKLSMNHFYLAWNSWDQWELNMWKLIGIHFSWCSKYPNYANAIMVL